MKGVQGLLDKLSSDKEYNLVRFRSGLGVVELKVESVMEEMN